MIRRSRPRTVLATCLLLLAAAASHGLQLAVPAPWGLLADAETQALRPPLTTPWLAKQESGGIVYFAYEAPARIERFDLAGGAWLTEILLAEAPTAFWADADGLYLSFGRRTSRFSLAGADEVHLRNTAVAANDLFTIGDVLYIYAPDDLLSADKWTGTLIDQEEYWYSMQGFSLAPGLGKAFARSTGVSPSDILQIDLPADGTLGLQDDSPHHGDYPSATKTWVYPDEGRVVDDSGIVYGTADLAYSGSLPGAFDDLDFHGAMPVVLRLDTLFLLSESGLRRGQYTPAEPPLGVAVYGDSVFSFYQGATAIEATEIPIAWLTMPTPAPPPDPVGLAYTPDAMARAADGVVYLLSRENLAVFRWSMAERRYIDTIALVEPPTFMAFSDENRALYLTYDTGEITRVLLDGESALTELPFVNSPQAPCGLATAGEFLFVCDPSGAWSSHFTYSPAGTLISLEDWRYVSPEFVWSPANRRMYFFRDHSPTDLLWEEIDGAGVLGTTMDSPYHSSEGIEPPIRLATDGSLVVLGSGRLYDAITLVQIDTLSNDIDDAVWHEGVLFTLRTLGGVSQIQRWDLPNWGFSSTRLVGGEPLGFFSLLGKVLVVTLEGGQPLFSPLSGDLSPIFTDGFESGDTSAWAASGGRYAGFLAVDGGAAASGGFGLEAEVGESCTADPDLVITGPAEAEGVFLGCHSVAAGGVTIGAAGATFAAGERIALTDGFVAPTGPGFAAAVDPATLSGAAWVEHGTPEPLASYDASWKLDLDGLSLAEGDPVEHLVGYSETGAELFRVLLLWNATLGEKRLAVEARQQGGSWLTTRGSEELVVTAGWVDVEIAWRSGGGDGHLLVSLDGAPFTGLAGLDSSLQSLARVRWGNVAGVGGATTGHLALDDFEAWE